MAAPNPSGGSHSPAISSSSSGLKLTLKLGMGSSAATAHPSTATASTTPTAPTHRDHPRPTPLPVTTPSAASSSSSVQKDIMLPPPTTTTTSTPHRPTPAPTPTPALAHHPIPSTSAPRAVPPPTVKSPPPTPFTRAELHKLEKEFKGVTTDKYRALKRKCSEVTESRDELSLALFRAQKQISRLRDEKSSLLTRVLTLETASGLSPASLISQSDESYLLTQSREGDHPLLHPPTLPSLEDRPRKEPIITTSTDLSNANYNAPIGPPPLPDSLPPRLRSGILRSSLAAERFRDNLERVRIAKALPAQAGWSCVSVLGLKGSLMGEKIERVLAGEDEGLATGVDSTGTSNKRRRESTAGSGKGKGRADTTSSSLRDLPNPFAFGAGAAPEGTFRGEAQAQAIATQQVAQATAAVNAAQRQSDLALATAAAAELAAAQSPASGISYDENEANVVPPRKQKKVANAAVDQSPQQAMAQADVKIKPKRLKTHGITSGNYSIPHIPRNDDGSPVLPLPVGIMILKKLGNVNPREHFHTERYIFPVGFECMRWAGLPVFVLGNEKEHTSNPVIGAFHRKYPSMINRTETVEYTSRIVDGGDGAPRFEIDAADQPGVIIAAGTPTGAWAQIVKAANKIRERNHSNSVSGPDYYGLAQNVIKALIQELPGASQLHGYIWQNFIEDEPAETLPDGKSTKKKLVSDKVRGAKRKMSMRTDEFGQPKSEFDEDEDMGGVGLYGSNGGGGVPAYSPSPSIVGRSMSPTGSPAFHDSFSGRPPSSLSGLLHQNPISNPYSLPPPSLDNAFHQSPPITSTPIFDPYAIPAPGATYTSPQHDPGPVWSQAGFPPQTNPYDIGATFPGFDQPMGMGGPPYGGAMDRGSNSSSSGDSSS